MSTRRDDELEEFRRGDSEVSRAYRRASAPQPRAVIDRRVLARARAAHARAAGTGTWAYAASIALALAVMFAVAYAPRRVARTDEAPHFLRTARAAFCLPDGRRSSRSPALARAHRGAARSGALPGCRRGVSAVLHGVPGYAATRGETGAAVR